MIALDSGNVRATVHPDDGGRLGQLEIGGRQFLKPREERELAWAYWGSYPLIPWSNRIVGGLFSFAGRTWRLPVNFPDGTAIHGLTCTVPWEVVSADATSCVLSVRVDTPPWTLTAEQRFTLTPVALVQEIAVVNDGTDLVPLGIGIHPWFPAGTVQVPAELIWPDVNCIPTGPPRPVSPEEDLRAGVPHPSVMDVAYTGLTGTAAKVGDLTIEWRGPIMHVVVYTGEPGWICVEPVTNATDAFNLDARGIEGTGTIQLAPGSSTSVVYTFRGGAVGHTAGK